MTEIREINATKTYSQAIVTTNATTTTALQLSTSSDKAYQVNARCIGKQDDGTDVSSYYELTTFRNDSGTLTEIGTADTYSHEDNTSTAFTVSASGTNINFDITGIASEIYIWQLSVDIIEV